MRLRHRSALVAVVLASAIAGPAAVLARAAAAPDAAAARRAISEKDLFDFVWVTDPQLSPDGSRVAFTRVVADEKRTGYDTSIWTVATAGDAAAVRLTNGRHDSQPRWSPDGTRLAFLRVGPKGEDGKTPPPQIAVLPLAGGEAEIVTDLPKGAGRPVWSPDGKRLAFLSSTAAGDFEQREADRRDTAAHHESDVHVITRAIYRSNDEGYLDPARHEHIWVMDVACAGAPVSQPTQLTTGSFDEHDPAWTPDGARIVFTSVRIDEPYYQLPTTDVYAVPSRGGELQKIASIAMDVGDVALSPDGRRIAFHGAVTQPVRSYSQPDLWVLELARDAQPRNLTAGYDFDMGDTVFGDSAAPRGGSGRTLHWTSDGRSLLDVVAREGRSPLVRVDAQSGNVVEVTRGREAVLDFSTTPDGRSLVALVSTPTMIGDLFDVAADGSERRLTNVNEKLWSQLELTEPEELTYTSFDGRKIQAWIQKPPGFDARKKYPLILNIHGGPHAAYGWVFDHEFQWMAARGYVVLYPNPRGSVGYGQEFGNVIQYHYPGDDYRDLMVGVDTLVSRRYIDPKRLGVTGGSGGGILTDWTVTHTDRFAAAVSQRDIANWASWWYTADFTLFQPTWFKAPPFQDPQEYVERSPITFVQQIRTPILFVLGERDYRTPPDSGGEQIFRALKFLKRPTAMVVFPRETHELSRSGEPWHRVERLEHIVGWFDKWLLGVPHPEYDVRPEKQVATPR